MTLISCINMTGIQVEVRSLRRWQTVDVSFINADGEPDETSFDCLLVGSKNGNKELSEMYNDFCKENGFKKNTVTAVKIVASADSYGELVRKAS